ncbi:hypothetical protein ABZV92_19330 [Streptomyces rubiginosohelvolus]|uniref:hypothetical protein n=1 Tax=Streptomyces rubiginosohelvolus TaxID=67362 RepID=UPI0033B664D4
MMAQYGITHACGHHETVQLYGKTSQREARARWLENSDCGSCWKSRQDRRRAQDAERDAAANRSAGLPELQGSPRQITWAETIRASMLDGLTLARERLTQASRTADGEEQRSRLERHLQHTDRAHAAIAGVTSAKWLIDHRDLQTRGLIQEAAQGTLGPRTPQQQTLGFDPHALNTLTFPTGDLAADDPDEKCIRLRLTHSRWEGCTALLPKSMVQQEPGGTLTARIGGAWTIRIDDGARIRSVPAEDFHQDRTHRRPHPAERHYWGPPRYADSTSGEFDVPEVDVSESTNHHGKTVAVVRLVCSRWEGLRFEHPPDLLRRHRPGHVTVRFGPHWHFRVLGGSRTIRVPAQQMYEDRTHPLPQPGPSQAVEPTTWHQVAFHPSRVRRSASTWWLRLPPGTPWPYAVIHHREQMVSVPDDSPDHITWRFPESWTFRARTPDGDTTTMSAEEFLAATSPWAGTAPAPGTYTRQPPALTPLVGVAVHADLLEDDPGAPEP